MVRHIVLFQLKQELDNGTKEKVMKEFKQGIEALPQVIPFIRNIEVCFNINTNEKWDICLNGEFDSLEDVNLYSSDSHHLAVAGVLKPYLAGRACCDYEY